MHVLSRKALRDFAVRYPEIETALDDWYQITSRAAWQNLVDVRRVFPHADSVGGCTVFNIGGNKARLVVWINYRYQRVFVRSVLTHSAYNRGAWKNDC